MLAPWEGFHLNAFPAGKGRAGQAGRHEPYKGVLLTTNRSVRKPHLQADLNQRKGSDKCAMLDAPRHATAGPLMPSHFLQTVKFDARARGASAVNGDD